MGLFFSSAPYQRCIKYLTMGGLQPVTADPEVAPLTKFRNSASAIRIFYE